MRYIVAGASGMVGSALLKDLAGKGHQVSRLVRRDAGLEAGEISWDPPCGELNPAALQEADGLVCLSGTNIAAKRWSSTRKKAILASRIDTVSLLSKTLASAGSPPKTLICASAVGYYGGNRGQEVLEETSESGQDFLAGVCRAWEDAAAPAVECGHRVVFLRFGVILDRDGGALRMMRIPFSLGLGGVVGSGAQYMSWITLTDAVRIIEFALTASALGGPINAVSPKPVTIREFTKSLGKVLSRPTLLPVPAFAVRLLLGEMGQALLLDGARCIPAALTQAGFTFQHPELQDALRHVLKS